MLDEELEKGLDIPPEGIPQRRWKEHLQGWGEGFRDLGKRARRRDTVWLPEPGRDGAHPVSIG